MPVRIPKVEKNIWDFWTKDSAHVAETASECETPERVHKRPHVKRGLNPCEKVSSLSFSLELKLPDD